MCCSALQLRVAVHILNLTVSSVYPVPSQRDRKRERERERERERINEREKERESVCVRVCGCECVCMHLRVCDVMCTRPFNCVCLYFSSIRLHHMLCI